MTRNGPLVHYPPLQLIGSWIIIRWILTNQGTLLTRENRLRAVRFEVNAVYR